MTNTEGIPMTSSPLTDRMNVDEPQAATMSTVS
jgi:hypothetical protein